MEIIHIIMDYLDMINWFDIILCSNIQICS